MSILPHGTRPSCGLALVLGALILTAAALPAFAQELASVRVALTSPAGEPLAGATVLLEPLRAGAPATAVTNADGTVVFADVRPGDYVLRAIVEGLSDGARQVTVRAGATLRLDLGLQVRALAEEITVTATKSARDALLVPGEVAVIDRQELDDLQARSLDDVLRYVPGVETGGARRLLQTPNIRGFDDRRVLVLRDGARIGQFDSAHKGSMFVEVNDVERIEVIRGPASALYGSGALGGVISITSRDPADLLSSGSGVGASLTAGYSDAFGEWTTNPRVFGASPSGFGWSLGYSGRRNDGNVSLGGDIPDLTRGEEDVDAISARLVSPVGERSRLRFALDTLRTTGDTLTNLSLTEIGPDVNIDRRTRQYTGTASFQSDGDRWFDERVDVNAWINDLDIREDRTADGRLEQIGYTTIGIDARNSAVLGDNTLTYGVEAFRDSQDGSRNDGENPFFPDGSQTQVGLYVQDELRLAGSRITLVPGVRWDRWSSDTDDPETSGSSDNRLNPKLGAVADLGRGFVATAGYGQGFRAPLLTEMFNTGLHFAFPLDATRFLIALFEPNPELRPETSRNVDLGLRYRNSRLEARAAYYRATVDNFIDTVVTATPFPPPGGVQFLFFESVNVQDATLWGWEASASWLAANRVLLRGGWSLPRGEDSVSDQRLASIPPSKVFVGADWQPTVWSTIGLNSRFYGSQDAIEGVIEARESYQLFDLYSSWSPDLLGGATLFLNVDNLGDEEYRIVPFDTPGTGRDVRVGFSWRISG